MQKWSDFNYFFKIRVRVLKKSRKSPHFCKPSKNLLSFIFGLILDAVLVCHVVWVIGFESGVKKICSSHRYEVEKLAQYRWDIRYIILERYWYNLTEINVLKITLPVSTFLWLKYLCNFQNLNGTRSGKATWYGKTLQGPYSKFSKSPFRIWLIFVLYTYLL